MAKCDSLLVIIDDNEFFEIWNDSGKRNLLRFHLSTLVRVECIGSTYPIQINTLTKI